VGSLLIPSHEHLIVEADPLEDDDKPRFINRDTAAAQEEDQYLSKYLISAECGQE
jgi:hypothetical protein